MNLHEYQAKEILKKYGLAITPFAVAGNIDEVNAAIDDLALNSAVLKVQIHAGGRGKAGGVKLARSKEEIIDYAKQMIGMKIINAQTGPEGIVCHKILISPILSFKKEYYLGAIIDRQKAQAILIASPEGGMEIEEIASTKPEKILTIPIDRGGVLRQYQLLHLSKFMGWRGTTAKKGQEAVKAVVKAFVDSDASLLEINPLVESDDGDIVALDAKMSLDDNALWRQHSYRHYYDASQVAPQEAQAIKHDLAYVALDGDIGCMVNGAGLAMATMDIIKLHGGTPANFLDVGGSADEEKIKEGFKILLSDLKVKAILVNIFGGIMNCITISAGIIAAAGELKIHVPLIVRMEGTNVEKGKKILVDSGLNITIADTLSDAAEKATSG